MEQYEKEALFKLKHLCKTIQNMISHSGRQQNYEFLLGFNNFNKFHLNLQEFDNTTASFTMQCATNTQIQKTNTNTQPQIHKYTNMNKV